MDKSNGSRDITGRKQVEDALRESEERYRVLTEVSPQVVWMGTSNGSITYCNQYWFDYTGLTMEQTGDGWALVKNGWASVIHPEDHERVLNTWKQAVASGTEYEVEIRFRRADDGAYRWHMARGLPVLEAGGQIVKWIGIASDIHERKQAEERLAHDALHDSLTGLANRSLFMDRLEHTIHRVRRTKEFSFAVLFLDLDRFKVINDSLGHSYGDQLLIAVARELTMSLRLGDTVARLGGDEFVILLEDLSDADEALKVAQRIHQSLSDPFTIENQEIFISTSIGIAFAASHYTQAAQLLRDADKAMYQAKSCGKACSAVFNPSMHHQAVRQFALESDLRRAIERQELVVYYQPIISLVTKKLQGVEALVRWQHPQQGMISPSEFIPIAEETGMIVNLDRQVLRLACNQLRSWQEQFPFLSPFTLSVNLSGKQFTQPNLVEYIEAVLTQTQMEDSCLKLEITESALIENPQAATEMIAQLQRRKIQICLDDFGTGYSSLSYLHRFLPNILKIDRSFVSHLEANNSNATIIRTIATMAHELGIGLIAEGVETKSQAAFLQFLGCKYGQGYWFSPPLCAEEMTSRLRTNNFTG